MIRCAIDGPDGKTQVKYLTWDQSKGDDLSILRPRGDFFDSGDYFACEPLWVRGGNWNHATICFYGMWDDEIDDIEVIHNVFQYERKTLPTLSEKAIWAEKPSVEWVGLKFQPTKLRDSFGVGMNSRRGKLRVVTHEAFGGNDFEMVM